jgi:alpha-galactosidase/6-phospho-beta-glucosidase family protein
MPKAVFLGAGSAVFAKNPGGDILFTETLRNSCIVLSHIDPARLGESRREGH